MNSHKKIFIAFLLNLFFSVFEFFGGILTGSVAILSDSLHDLGDAVSIGISFILEKISKRKPDSNYTYGYARYSVIGSVFTTMILIAGSVVIITNAVRRIISPTEIDYNNMIILAVVGAAVNILAAFFTKGKGTLNQAAVNLHMLEDVLGWIVVLIGAVVMKFTGITIIDPILSIGVSLFILASAIVNLKEALELFLEKTPKGLCAEEISKHISELDGIDDVHHLHLWSMDGTANYATMHVVTNENQEVVKRSVRQELEKLGITHATIEIESASEVCTHRFCEVAFATQTGHTHHHHHHHH